MGEEETVLACLQRARDQRDPWFPFVAADPAFRDWRESPQFARIAQL
jgi:hypothetical protein